MKILVVDDEATLVKGIKFNLVNEGYQVDCCYDGETAVDMARAGGYHLIILDLMMPKVDGLEACQQIRQFSTVPIIMLTARSEDSDKLLGFESGADDYITKPFNPDVLLARIKAVLRRGLAASAAARLTVGDLVIDPAAHVATVAGRPVELTAREFGLLHALALEAGKVLSIDDLIQRVWGAEFSGEPQVVYVHVRWLREKIEADPNRPKRIVNVRGVGYKLTPQG